MDVRRQSKQIRRWMLSEMKMHHGQKHAPANRVSDAAKPRPSVRRCKIDAVQRAMDELTYASSPLPVSE
jgi:hypothetical protein